MPSAPPNYEEEVLMEIGGPSGEGEGSSHLSELERVDQILAQGPATFFQEPGYFQRHLSSILFSAINAAHMFEYCLNV